MWNANNFLITNECDFTDIDKISNLSVNINKWIYAELIDAKSKIEKNLEDYRFDEAAKNAYQFAWHSYCDWYLELSNLFLSQISSVTKGINGCSRIKICLNM